MKASHFETADAGAVFWLFFFFCWTGAGATAETHGYPGGGEVFLEPRILSFLIGNLLSGVPPEAAVGCLECKCPCCLQLDWFIASSTCLFSRFPIAQQTAFLHPHQVGEVTQLEDPERGSVYVYYILCISIC